MLSTLAEPVPGAADGGGAADAPACDRATLARVFEDTCGGDVARLRALCAVEPAWARAARLLDREGGAGWKLLGALLTAREDAALLCGPAGCAAPLLTARGLLASPLFRVAP